ncbi:MAG: C45 family autoproteolytic acyltransferase/hydrolase, partial [Pseudomonadota bacterium]
MAGNDDNSVALPVVRAAGDPFERGRALGLHARQAIHEAVRRTAGFQGLLRWRGAPELAALEAAARARFPAYVAEVEGLASGADWSFEEAFLWNCRGDLRSLDDTKVIGCTTLFDATPANYLIAHNEDGAPEFAEAGFMVDWRPSEGLAAWSFAYPGMLLGHSFAVNAKGLVQTINNIRANDAQPGVPRHFVTRAILDCADLDEALDLIVDGPRASGFHHGLAQAGDPRILSVEAPASDFA